MLIEVSSGRRMRRMRRSSLSMSIRLKVFDPEAGSNDAVSLERERTYLDSNIIMRSGIPSLLHTTGIIERNNLQSTKETKGYIRYYYSSVGEDTS